MIRFFAAHPTAGNLVMIGFLVAGLFAAPMLRRETFPRVDSRRVEVTVALPGARAEEVEDAICQRIEDAVDSVDNVDEVACEALDSRGRAVIEMVEGKDIGRFFTDIKTEIDAIDSFPDEAEAPVIRQLGRTDFVASVALAGPMSPPDLKAYAEQVKDRMLRWGGISKVEIRGFSQHQVRIELTDATLRRFGLSADDIADVIARQSVDLPAGSLQTAEREISVRFADERRRLHEFADLIVVTGKQGAQIRLGEIAAISDRFDLDEEKVFYQGRRAALLDISKTAAEDTLDAIDAVAAFVAAENATAPKAVVLAITNDGSSIVRDRMELLIRNGAQGLVLVFLIMWTFFGFRYSFWVTMGLPVSFLGAIALMQIFGYSLNMLTMVALLIAIGLLMDDAIVISENVARHRQQGKAPLDAVIDGARQVLPSIFASFTTTACVFGSLAFLEGDIGAIIRVVPAVMLMVLSVSLIEAFLVLPNHLKHSLANSASGRISSFRRIVDERVEAARQVAGRVAGICIEWRYLTIGAAVGALLISVSMLAGGAIKFIAFPALEGDVAEARILLPQGTPLARTEAVVGQVEAALKSIDRRFSPEQPDGQPLVRSVTVRFNKNVDAFETGPHVATLTVDLLNAEIRNTGIDAFFTAWREAVGDIPDVIGIKYAETVIGPGGLPIDIRLSGDDLDALGGAAAELTQWLGRYRGVFNLSDDLRPGKPEVKIRLSEGATMLGLDARTVARQLRTAFFGATASEIQVGPEAYDVDVRLAAADKNSLADLDYFTVTTADGNLAPLSAVARLEAGRGLARINRIDGLRTVTVQGDVDGRLANANAIINDTFKRFVPDLKTRYPGLRIGLEGQNSDTQKTQSSMARGFILGLIGVFLLLSFQFRSYFEPLVVMVAIPMAFIGVVWGHWLMGLDISMPSMLGFASLAGVVVNDSILLVNFIKLRHGEGIAIAEAATQASRERFRAILLTSVTTVAGLLPILSETSLQAQVLIPLVTSLAFGLIASTVLVLIVVPALYVALDDMGMSSLSKEDGPA